MGYSVSGYILDRNGRDEFNRRRGLLMSNLSYLPNTIAEGMYKVLVPTETMRMVETSDNELGSTQDVGVRLMSRTDLLLTLGRFKSLAGVYSSVNFTHSMASFGVYGCVVWELYSTKRRISEFTR